MIEATWVDLETALDRAAASGPVRFWLRDDDAVDVTPALERLASLCRPAGMPVLLAVIPAGVTPDLADWLAREPLFTACQHGVAHVNHAVAGERACELGGALSDETVLAALAAARERLQTRLAAADVADILVPPWNRIRATLVPHLAELGYAALSTFTGTPPPADSLPRLDCDLDIVDWRNGRRGRSQADLCGRLIRLVDEAAITRRPIGLLTHHLAHDAAAWTFLETFLSTMQDDPRVRFVDAVAVLGQGGSRNADAPMSGIKPA